MNEIAIGIRYNRKAKLIGIEWPKLATLKAMGRHELGRLKRNVRNTIERVAINRVVDRVAMAFKPMPNMAMA